MPVFLSIFRVTDLLFSNQLWIQHLTRKFHGDIFFQFEYFCGADSKKKKGKNRKFCATRKFVKINVKTSFVSQVLLLKKWNTFNYFSYNENNFSMDFSDNTLFYWHWSHCALFFSSWFPLKRVASNRDMWRNNSWFLCPDKNCI